MPEALAETLQRYLRRYSTILQPSSLASRREAMNSFLRTLASSYPEIKSWNQLHRLHIDAWLEQIRPLSPGTRILRIYYLSRFFCDLRAWQWPQAPVPDLIGPQDFPLRPHYLPKPLPSALDQPLLQTLASIPSLPAYGLRLLRHTGMRIGEMRDLGAHALTEVSPAHFTLRVPIGKTKQERVIPVSVETAALIHLILAQRADRAQEPSCNAKHLMINPNGRRLSYAACWRALRKAAQHLNTTENIHPHRLRHTFATEMARAGMSVPALMKLLGHQTPAMTLRYVEVSTIDLQRAYHQALAQLKTLNRLIPSLSAPLPDLNADAPPLPVEDLFATLIQRVESHRRDTRDSATKRQLHRLIDRLRKARKDLRKIP